MNNYQVYLFDLDGTVYAGNRPINSTISYINYLISQNKKVLMVSNNATVSIEAVKTKLSGFGIDTNHIDVVTSAMATAFKLKEYNISKAYIIGEQVLKTYCAEAGIFHTDVNPEAVIVGLDKKTTYEKLAKAAEFLQKLDIPFFATNYDWRLAQADYFLPGAGTLVNLIEIASARKAEIIGKPHRALAEYLINILSEYELKTWVMIGDNYDTDILFGFQNGIDTCFIETGVHTIEHIKKQKKQPTYMVEKLTELIK